MDCPFVRNNDNNNNNNNRTREDENHETMRMKQRWCFPSALLVDHILPFLDRNTYEAVLCLNHDVYDSAQLSNKLPPPWPETVLLLKSPSSSVQCATFSSSSRAIACGCDDGSIYLWNRQNGKRQQLVSVSTTAVIGSLHNNNNNNNHSSAQPNPNSTTMSPFLSSSAPAVLSIAFSSDEQYLATGHINAAIYLWKLGKDFQVLQEENRPFLLVQPEQQQLHHHPPPSPPPPILTLSFFPDSSYLVSAGHETQVNLWNVSTQTYLGRVEHPEKVESVAVSPQGNCLATSTWDGTVRVFHIPKEYGSNNHTPSSASSSSSSSSSSSPSLGSLLSNTPTVQILGKGLPLTAVQWSPDGLYVHGLKGFRLRKWQVPYPILSSSSSSSWKEQDDAHDCIAAATNNCTCLSGRRVNRIHSIALSVKGDRVAYSEGDGTIRVSTLASAYYKADIKRTLLGHTEGSKMEFSPDGKCLISGSTDGTLRLWTVT